MRSGIQAFFPTCRQAARLQSDALDQELDLATRFGLRLHLLACAWCRRYGKQLRFLHHAAGEHAEELTEAAPHKLSPEAKERLQKVVEKG